MPGIKVRNRYLGLKLGRRLHKHRRGPCMYPEGIAYDKFFREVLWIHIFGAALSENKACLLIYTRFSMYSRRTRKKDGKQSEDSVPRNKRPRLPCPPEDKL